MAGWQEARLAAPGALRARRRTLALTRAEVDGYLGVTPDTVVCWEREELSMSLPARVLALLERISLAVPAAEARIDRANIARQLAWMHARDYITQAPPIDRVVDARFVAGVPRPAGR